MEKQTKYIDNRKVRHDYFIEDTFRAGIVLCGSEVKSIRNGRVNISDAYCYINEGELFLRNAHVTAPQTKNTMMTHVETCDRKLLLTKHEIKKITKAMSEKGYTCVPLSLEIPSNGYIKCNIAICKGKKDYDKRDAIKERDLKRDVGLS